MNTLHFVVQWKYKVSEVSKTTTQPRERSLYDCRRFRKIGPNVVHWASEYAVLLSLSSISTLMYLVPLMPLSLSILMLCGNIADQVLPQCAGGVDV